jgi:hypothetical protein
MMAEQKLLGRHTAEAKVDLDRLREAMRQEGVDFVVIGDGDSRFAVYAERARLFEVLGLQTLVQKAGPRLQHSLHKDYRKLTLQRADGTPPTEFLLLNDIAENFGEFSQYPAMLAWEAADQQRSREAVAFDNQRRGAKRTPRRRQRPPRTQPLPFNVDALARILGYRDRGDGGRRQPDGEEPVDRWFMNERLLSLYVRHGEIILEARRYDLSEAERNIPIGHPLWCELNFRVIMFPVPQTADEALSQLIRVGLWGDTPEEREAFFVDYQEALQAEAEGNTQQG